MIANLTKPIASHRRRLGATAESLMTRNPLSICEGATLREAAIFLTSKEISAAPVINEAGRPVGVISLADIVRSVHVSAVSHAGIPLTIREVMTPVVFFVRPDTPVANVVEDLLDCAVHRLFVVDASGVLVGVISTLDLLKHLHETEIRATVKPPFEERVCTIRELRRRRKQPAAVTSGSDIVAAGGGR